MALTPKVRIGCSDVVYALETSDPGTGTPTWGTVYPLLGLKSISVNPNGVGATFFGDNRAFETAETIGDIDVDFTEADLLPEDEARLLGYTYANGQIGRQHPSNSPYIALGFKVLRSDSSTQDYFWLFKGKMIKPDQTSETKAADINWQPIPMKGKFLPLRTPMNGYYYWLNKLRTDDTNVPSATITNFFVQPTLPSADITALSATILEGTVGDAGKIIWTFSKVSASSFSLISTTCTSTTLPVYVAAGLRAGSYAVGAAGTTVAVKFTPTVAFSSLDNVSASIVPNGVTDNSSVTATVNGKIIVIA